ncbi:MAG: chitin binding domain-containing protein [Bacteroidales bacterium]|jgi:hypothetical protein|nr:chitin binding domain-containing protein [Bacteroidales bacterium]
MKNLKKLVILAIIAILIKSSSLPPDACPVFEDIVSPNPDKCNEYYQCRNGVPIQMRCPPGLHFNPWLKICDWPQPNSNCLTYGNVKRAGAHTAGTITMYVPGGTSWSINVGGSFKGAEVGGGVTFSGSSTINMNINVFTQDVWCCDMTATPLICNYPAC